MAAVRKRFVDTFNRTSSGLGTASDGSLWSTLRGTWSVSTNTATFTAASDRPLATQAMPYQNADIVVAINGPGMGAALWVTDSNNWWAVGTNQEQVSCNCSYYTCCTQYGCSTFGCTGYQCSGYYICVAYGCLGYGCSQYSRGNCIAYGCALYAGYGCTAYSCVPSCSGYGCTSGYGQCLQNGTCSSCQTCYPNSIRVLQSVANSLTAITSWTLSAAAAALRIKTTDNQINITAYSDSAATTVIDSAVNYTASGATLTKSYGLNVSPASYGQGTQFSSIKINPN